MDASYVNLDVQTNPLQAVMRKDVSEWLDEMDFVQATEIIDSDTGCDDISCSATGMECLGCQHFEAGNIDPVKLRAVEAIIINEFRNIEKDIQYVNSQEKNMLKDEFLFRNALESLHDRFERINLAKEKTLYDAFGMTERDIRQRMVHCSRVSRNTDLTKSILNNAKKKGIDLSWYRTINNRKVTS